MLLDLMKVNVELNVPNNKSIAVAEYNWGEDVPADVPADVDVVLAADCVYFEVSFTGPLSAELRHWILGCQCLRIDQTDRPACVPSPRSHPLRPRTHRQGHGDSVLLEEAPEGWSPA